MKWKALVWGPLSWLYHGITSWRNRLYDRKVLKSVRFEAPVIVVGNLSVGGTGKSPHIEYLIRLLSPQVQVATISRGYRRKTTGFLLADNKQTALTLGDEPFVYHARYPGISVAVAEDRVLAVPRLLSERPETQVILMDDAFQHRAVRPGLSILLTEFDKLYTRDSVMPLGWLRESASGAKRADIIVVTKCPLQVTAEQKKAIIEELRPESYQHVYFSGLAYQPLYSLFREVLPEPQLATTDTAVLFLSGIADNTQPLQYLKQQYASVYPLTFGDHHRFDVYDLEKVRDALQALPANQKWIITTEKDAARLWLHRDWFIQNRLPVLVLPVQVVFVAEDKGRFEHDIFSFVEKTLQQWQGTA
ncbi:MAG: tetraacyldisaccharide 4'-kinase [Chitinophagales bacterium]